MGLTGSTTTSNTVAVNVGFGPNGQSGGYYDGIFVTLNVCTPGTSTCVSVPNVLVDTGSVGVRILASAIKGGVTTTPITDSSNDVLNECTMYGDGSFNWGPVELATVQVGGETASGVPVSAGGTANTGIPIQIISTYTVPTAVQERRSMRALTHHPRRGHCRYVRREWRPRYRRGNPGLCLWGRKPMHGSLPQTTLIGSALRQEHADNHQPFPLPIRFGILLRHFLPRTPTEWRSRYRPYPQPGKPRQRAL